jgi:hypothetical protein
MYATVRRYEGVVDPSEAARRVNEGFLQIISEIPGFAAYYWVDAGGGVMVSTSVFQDQASAEESNKLRTMCGRIWSLCSQTRLRSRPVKLSRTGRNRFC